MAGEEGASNHLRAAMRTGAQIRNPKLEIRNNFKVGIIGIFKFSKQRGFCLDLGTRFAGLATAFAVNGHPSTG
jgi:hypothetical protein